MDAHRVYIFNEADRDHVVVLVADNFELKLFPAEDGLLNEDLMHQGCLETAGHDHFELFFVIDETAAGAAHRVGRAKNDRVAEFVSNLKTFFHAVSDLASRHLDSEHVHGLFEFDTVLAALDRVDLNADDLYIIFIENTFLVEL